LHPRNGAQQIGNDGGAGALDGFFGDDVDCRGTFRKLLVFSRNAVDRYVHQLFDTLVGVVVIGLIAGGLPGRELAGQQGKRRENQMPGWARGGLPVRHVCEEAACALNSVNGAEDACQQSRILRVLLEFDKLLIQTREVLMTLN
jgi:hypothetical protein